MTEGSVLVLLRLQGFLYVFGGMMDSSFSSCRFPLWMFDISEFLSLFTFESNMLSVQQEDHREDSNHTPHRYDEWGGGVAVRR